MWLSAFKGKAAIYVLELEQLFSSFSRPRIAFAASNVDENHGGWGRGDFKLFKVIYPCLRETEDMDKPDLSVPVSSTLQDKFRFGWKWFIDLKTHVFLHIWEYSTYNQS